MCVYAIEEKKPKPKLNFYFRWSLQTDLMTPSFRLGLLCLESQRLSLPHCLKTPATWACCMPLKLALQGGKELLISACDLIDRLCPKDICTGHASENLTLACPFLLPGQRNQIAAFIPALYCCDSIAFSLSLSFQTSQYYLFEGRCQEIKALKKKKRKKD